MTWEAFRSSTAANADAESRPAEPRRAAPEPESAPRRFAWERGNRSEQQNGQRLRRLWLGHCGRYDMIIISYESYVY